MKKMPRKFLGFRLYKSPTYSLNFFTPNNSGLGYDNWNNRIKKIVPIQYWFRECFLDFFTDIFNIFYIGNPDHLSYNKEEWKPVDYISAIEFNPHNKIVRNCFELKYYVRDLIFPWNIIKIKTLTCRWHDRDTVLLHASMQILVDYFEQEERWTVQLYDKELEIFKNEGQTYSYESLLLQKENYLKVKEIYDWWKQYSVNFQRKYGFENQDIEKENEMLKKLIAVRSTLWS